MNRNYKVIWNQSLNCFMAVAEYAKSRGKSSSAVVSSNAASASNDTLTGGAQLLRLSALCVGLASAGFSMQAVAVVGASSIDTNECLISALGTDTMADKSTGDIAIGCESDASGRNNIAIGGRATTKVDAGDIQGAQSIAIGYDTQVKGDQSIGFGANVRSNSSSSIAIGGDDLDSASKSNIDGSTNSNLNSGDVNEAFKKFAGRDLVYTAAEGASNPNIPDANRRQYIGTETAGAASVAIGVQAQSIGALSTAFGTQATSIGVGSTALGVSATATKSGSVALGAGAETDSDATSEKTIVIGGNTYNFAGSVLDDVGAVKLGAQVSVGAAGLERQIKNVAGGKISTDSTDAINGSQLAATNSALEATNNNIVGLTNGSVGLVRQDNGTNPITVGNATGGTSVNFAGTNGVRTLSGLANGNVTTGSTEAVTGDQLNTTNTHVTDNSNRSTGNLAALGGNAAYDAANNTYTAPTYTLDDGTNTTTNTTVNNVGDALGNLDTRTTTNTTDIAKGINVGDGTTDNNFALGNTINVTGDSNLTSSTTADGVQVSLNESVDLGANGSVRTGNTTVNRSGITLTGGTNQTVTLSNEGLNNGGNRITKVADGIVADDAVNFGQLDAAAGAADTKTDALGNSTASNLGGGASYNAATGVVEAPIYTLNNGDNDGNTTGYNDVGSALGNLDGRTTANTSGLADLASGRTGLVRQDTGTSAITVGAQTGGTSVDFSNSTNENRKLTGVAAGTADNDAVNVSQLNTTNSNVATNASNITDNDNRSAGNLAALGGGAAYDAATDTYTAPTYTLDDGTNTGSNTTVNNVGGALSNLDTRTTTNTADIAKGFNISAAGGTNDNVQLGESVNFTNTDGNLVVTNTVDNGINYDLAENISVTQATIGDATNNTVLTSTANGLDVGGDKITNLSNGTIAAGSSDAVTGDQLNTTNQNVAANRTDIDTNTSDIDDINAGRTGIVRQDAGTGAITVGAATGGTSVNFTGTDGVRTLSGLANGNVAAGSNDAVTGDQLNTTNTNVTANRTDIDINAGNITDNSNRSTGNLAALGGGAAYDAATDTYTAPTYTLDDGTNTGSNITVNNVGGALGNLDIRTTTNTTDINKGISFGNGTTDNNFALGDTINVTGDSNITSTTTANGVQVSLNESVDLGANGSFTAGNSVLNNTGLTITGGPSITSAGINAAGNKITNVDDGTDAGDAVNFGQLEASSNAADTKTDVLGNSTASNLGGGANYNAATGAVSAPSYTLDDGTNASVNTTVNNVGAALTNLDGRTTTNTSDIDDINAGRTGIVRQDAGTGAITVGAQTGGTSVNFTGTDGVRTLSGLANGNVATGSTEAVTGDQLNTTNTNITDNSNRSTGNLAALGGNAAYDAANNTYTAPTYTLDDGTNTTTNTTVNNVGDALGNLDIRTTTNTTDINKGISVGNGTTDNNFALGDTINFTGDSNITSTTTVDGVQVTLNDNIDVNRITAGNSTLNNAGVTIVDGPNNTVTLSGSGLNNGNNRITNLADGIAPNDAATFGQLTDTNNIATGNLSALGGGATYNAVTDTYTAPTYTLNNGSNTGTTSDFDNVGSALGNLDGRTTANTSGLADLASGRTGLVRQDTGTSAITVGAQTGGTSVNFTNVGGDARQLTGVASAGDISLPANANTAVNAGDMNAAVTGLTNAGLNFQGDDGTLIDRNLGDTLRVTGSATGNLTTGNIGVVADGTDGLSVQLAENINLGTDGSVMTGNTVTDNTGVTITDGTVGGNSTTITAAGTNVTDGINTSNYGANGFTATDGINSTTVGTGRISVSGVDNTDPSNPVSNTLVLDGNTGQISGVADATAADQAINKGQLDAIANAGNTKADALGNSTASNLGGGANYNAATGAVSAPSYTLDDGTNASVNTTVNNVGAALTNLDGRTTTNTSDIDDINAGRTGIVRQDAGTGAITVGAQTNGNSVDFTGTDGVRTLSGLTNGNVVAGSTEAVTGDQLNSSAASLATVIGGNATNASGIVTATNIGGTGVNTIDGAISSVKDAATKAKSTVTEGKNITVSETVNTDGSTDYEVKTKEDLALTSVTTGNTVTNTAGVSIDDGADNITTMTSAGTNVTDGTNTSNYGAEGFSATDNAGNNGITVNQGGISFINGTGDTTGPIITAQGIDANATKITNLANGSVASDAATFGQLSAIAGNITAGGVQYDRNDDDTVNYDRVIFNGTQAVIGKDDNDNNIVVSGGTTLTNIANGINAADAVNKGQLDRATKVKIFDKNGDEVTINIAEQVANTSVDNSNLDSLFLTYDVEGQEVTDRLSIGQTVQKMNTEGVKFAHTNAVSADGDLGITNDSSAGGANSTAIGVNAIVESGADSTIALGFDTKATTEATNSVVIGKGSQVNGASSVAIGDGAQANGTQSISVGTGNIVNGNNSGAFGDPSIIDGNNSYSVGNNNTIDSDDTFVFGNNVTQTVEGSVVLGTGSAAMTGAGIIGFGAVGNAAIMATTSTTGAVAVGDAANGTYRQITGVAAGTADSDAVNVSQLKAVSDALGDSNASLNNAAVQYDENPDDNTVNKGSITLGGGAGGTTITNVANGVGATDAVNKGQLDNLGSGVAGIIGGDAQYDAAGNLTVSNIGGTGKGNISDAIAAVNQGNAQSNQDIQANNEKITDNTGRLDAGISFGADNGDNISQSVGGNNGSIQFEGGNNITTSTANGGIQIGLDGNIEVDSVTTGNTVVDNTGVTIKDGPSMTAEGFNAANTVITGVEAGTNEKDAVNFGQLTALDKKLGDSVNALGYRVGEVEDNANAGISAAMAMSSLPQAYIPGKSMVGGGIASYNGESAVAVGVSKVSDNGRWVIKVNGTADTQGNAGGAIGAGFHF
ncbi:YadA-like family protein [Psychrobacter sp. P2G3]|uniref:YadA-like family protein n=1 Tax=Psychrobacter sp. P2G3 TaxID=1699622 RepID=UPI00078CFC29|nr:YadA-like family protein [Psychrobacter sp. P2G3]AMN50178.1 hypothetical protein AK823_10120 [Psychrobacter sp. P2G3]